MTLKQQKDQQQQMLLNDINYIIDNTIIDLRNDFQDNLYYMYNYYLENKSELLEKTLNDIKSQKIEILKETATNNGFEFKKVLINKHNITINNVYDVANLIENLFDSKINDYINKKEKERKTKDKLYNNYINNDDNKSPPKKKGVFLGLRIIEIILAIIFGVLSGLFSGTKKRR